MLILRILTCLMSAPPRSWELLFAGDDLSRLNFAQFATAVFRGIMCRRQLRRGICGDGAP